MSFYVTAISATVLQEIARTDKAHLIYFEDIETIVNEPDFNFFFFTDERDKHS
jgi:hypothetical protein